MPMEPISRHVLRYFCPFCHRGSSKKPAAIAHIARCYKNPEARSCKTCACYQPRENSDYNTGYPGCPEGCNAIEIDLTKGMPINCSDWERRPTFFACGLENSGVEA